MWILGPGPQIKVCHSVAAGHLSDCSAGGKGSGHQGGRGWDRTRPGSRPLSDPQPTTGRAPSRPPISFLQRQPRGGRATSPAQGAELGPYGLVPRGSVRSPLGERPSGPRPRGLMSGGVEDPEEAGFWPVLRLGIWPSLAPLLPVTRTSRPCLRHHVPRTVHVTHDSPAAAAALTHEREGLGPRALVHQHLLVLPVSGGHKLVPLPRWGALSGKEPESKGEHGRREMLLPPGSPPRGTQDGPSWLSPADPLSPPPRHTDSTLMVDEVLEPPSCSQRLFLLMSPATMSWGQKEDTSPLQTAGWGPKPWALLSCLALPGQARPACLLPAGGPRARERQGRAGCTFCLHPAKPPSPRRRPRSGPAWVVSAWTALPGEGSYLAGGALGSRLSLHLSRLPPALGACHGHAGQLDGGLAS